MPFFGPNRSGGSKLFAAVVLTASVLITAPLLAQGKNPKTPVEVEEPAAPSKPSQPLNTPNYDHPPTDEIIGQIEMLSPDHASDEPPPDILPSEPATGELATQIQNTMRQLEEGFPDGEGDEFREILAQHPDAEGGAFFGHTLFMRRQFDRAAWFFAADALARGNSAAALSNFASALEETVVAGAAPSAKRGHT